MALKATSIENNLTYMLNAKRAKRQFLNKKIITFL